MMSRRKKFVGKLVAWLLKRIQSRLLKKPYLKALASGERMGRLVWRLAKGRRDRAVSNLMLAFPDMGEDEAAATTKRVFENFGRSSADFLIGLDRTKEELEATTTIEGFENFEKAHAKGKGVMLVTGHFGNWERCSTWLVQNGYKLSVVARDANDEGVNALVNELRKGPGTEVIPRGSAVRPMIKRLKRNEAIGIVPDQNANEIFIPFFGKPAGTVLGPGVIAERTGAAVVPAFCHYVGEGKYHIKVYPELVAEPGYETKGEGMMRAIGRQLEEVIRERPDQWLWIHDRWRYARRKGLL